MEIVRCGGAGEFLQRTLALRAREPVRTNVMGSVANQVRGGRHYTDYWWWLVVEDGHVVGAAFRTAPYGLSLCLRRGDGTALAAAIADVDPDLPWLEGSEDVAREVVAELATREDVTWRRAVEGRRSVLYEVTTLERPVRAVDGAARVATFDDLELLEVWMTSFHEYVDGEDSPPWRGREALIASLREGALWLWCSAGEPVAMAGHASPVSTPSGAVTRLGPIFTPAARRGAGYASALTFSLSESLLEGSRVMLYADAANPTSNAVYRRLGFREVERVLRFEFER